MALSPDGRRVAFVATTNDGRDLIWIRALDSLESRPLEGTNGAAYPFWSPDGRALAFFAQGKLKRIDAAGGSPQVVCDAPSPRGGSWSSSGTIVFAPNIGGVMHRVPENGGQPAALPALNSKEGYTYRWPFFLPDGRHFLYFLFGPDVGVTGVYVASIDTGKTVRLVSAESGAVYAAPGFLLFPSGGRLMGQRFDADRLRLSGDAFPIIDHLWWDSTATGAVAISASDTGLLACQTGGSSLSRLLWYDRSGRELGASRPGWRLLGAESLARRSLARGRPHGSGEARGERLDDRPRARILVADLLPGAPGHDAHSGVPMAGESSTPSFRPARSTAVTLAARRTRKFWFG